MASAVAVGVASNLLPVAYYLGRSCWRRVRDVSKVQKSVVVIPSKSGKSHLSRSLTSTTGATLIDLDEFIRVVNSAEEIRDIEDAQSKGDTGLHRILSGIAYDKAFDFVRGECLKNPKMKAVFLTNDLEWATRRFKNKWDAVYVSLPSGELFKKICDENPADRLRLEHERAELLSRLPYESVATYNTFDELEKMLKHRFNIQSRI
jgi:hypothetical protein